jgi:hypothetical protein
MAFAFKVETGVGLVDSTSYASTDYADDYFEPTSSAAVWAALTDEKKEYLLAWATRFLDQKATWKGTISSETQALRWPRTGAYTKDRIAIGGTVVPRQLKDATCEVAKYLIENDPTAGATVDQFKKLVVDVIEIEFQDQTTQSSFPTIINSILGGIGAVNVGMRQASKILRS